MNSKNTKYYILGTIVILTIIIFTIIYAMLSTNKVGTNISQQRNTTLMIDTDKATSSASKVTNLKSKAATPVSQPSLPKIVPVAQVVIPLPVGTDQFTISIGATTTELIAKNLFDKGFIVDQDSFISSALKAKFTFIPGAYKLSKTMTANQVLSTIKAGPYMKWIIIPEGLRKEEIASLLAKNLGWTNIAKKKFIDATNVNPDYTEGVYFPETYLIPIVEKPEEVANRLVSKFNEKFSSLLPQFSEQNIKWTTGLTLASIVQREAANNADTPLIAGILWNRLNQDMALGVDATLQYIRGDKGAGYWAPITVADKKTESPYNTYLNTGLPPHPISNPGLSAIKAVLQPASTTCLYYIHDAHRVTHCATTYEEHKLNIQKYL
ncbi:MAG: endolytic transglycosylase MltG [bacterium]